MRTAHVRCGSDIRGALDAAGLEGDFFEYADPVCDGPAPGGLDPADFRRIRAAYMAAAWGGGGAEYFARLAAEDAALDRLADYDRVLLWFEHDLYDQSILIRLLDRLAGLADRLQLICIDGFPGVVRFVGLGQLAPADLAELAGLARPVTPPMVTAAQAAWAAFRDPDPQPIAALAASGSPALPFLGAALRRHLREFPWTADGLSLTERLALRAVARGAATPVDAFRALVDRLDPQPYLGDAMFWAILRRLAEAPRPALTRFADPRERIAPTRFGRALLDGAEDWVAANGIDRWRGGAHLSGADSPWRWDEGRGALVAR